MHLVRIPRFLYVERLFISLISIFFNGFLMKFPAHAFKTDLTSIVNITIPVLPVLWPAASYYPQFLWFPR